MTEERLRDYYAAWSTGDADRILSFFADDAVFEDLAFEAEFEGLAGIRGFIEMTYTGIPDFLVESKQILIGVETAAAAWEMSGTHSGDLPNLPATGKRFRVRASSIISFEDSKIFRIVDYWNPIQFQRQVGLV